MQFSYHKNSGNQILKIDGSLYTHLFKARRETKKIFYFRNLKDNYLYKYNLNSINRREAILDLISSKIVEIKPKKELHIGWCIVDPKSIEKNIASLNELGVTKITFFYCQYSQKKYKINFDKLEKLLINSSMQCGRSNIIELLSCNNLDEFLQLYPNSYMLNFSSNYITDENKDNIKTIIIGCEGGFSEDEISKILKNNIIGIDSNIILRSETAALFLASKLF